MLDSLAVELERLGLIGKAVRVTEAHVKEFEACLWARVRSGDLDPGTARDRPHYLKLALDQLGYTLIKAGAKVAYHEIPGQPALQITSIKP